MLTELSEAFTAALGEFTLPEGSVVLIGSLSHLMEEGPAGYCRGLVKEFRRFSGLYRKQVHIVPFVPFPMGGTNDPSLLKAIMDVSSWLEEVQPWDLTSYYDALRAFITGEGKETEGTPATHYSTRVRLPVALDTYTDKVFICHDWPGLETCLHPTSPISELTLLVPLLTELNATFKWNLDTSPLLSRERSFSKKKSSGSGLPGAIIIGGSNAVRLHGAMAELDLPAVLLGSGGWTLSAAAVNTLIIKLAEILSATDPSAPIVLYCIDNSSFKAMQDGELLSITKGADNKYHVAGDLAVTPFSLLGPALREIDRIVGACGGRRILILSPVVRYLMKPCCDEADHCTNTRNRDVEAAIAGRAVLDDLSDLNYKLKNRFTTGSVSFISTEDLLCGKVGASRTEILDNLENCWSSNPVHGDKLAYTKIAMGVADLISGHCADPGDLRVGLNSKKRFRERSPSPTRMQRDRSRERSRGRDQSGERSREVTFRHSARSGYPDGPSGTGAYGSGAYGSGNYSTWPGDYRRGGGGSAHRGRGRGGGWRY